MSPHLHTTRFLFTFLLLVACAGIADESDIEGTWLTEDADGWVELSLEGTTLSGLIAGSPNTIQGTPPRLDVENPDPELRTRQLDGLKFLRDFRYDGNGRWTDGSIYDPNSGKTYKGTISIIDRDTLKLRGYIGISLFGRSETWTRVKP